MTDAATDIATPTRRMHPRLRFELIFGSAWLGFGLFVLPGLIFWVGTLLLGPYGESGGLADFYGDFFADLAEPSVRAWAIALGPLVIISLARAVFTGVPRTAGPQTPPEPPEAAPPRGDAQRVEPRVTLD